MQVGCDANGFKRCRLIRTPASNEREGRANFLNDLPLLSANLLWHEAKNPYSGDSQAAAGGKNLYAQNCSQCHGNNLQGMGPAPTLLSAKVKHAAPGQLFWFITNGDLNNGMPGWSQLSKQQRWQVVTFLESKNSAGQ